MSFELNGIWRNSNSLLALMEIIKNEHYKLDYFVSDVEKISCALPLGLNSDGTYTILSNPDKHGGHIKVIGDNTIKVEMYKNEEKEPFKLNPPTKMIYGTFKRKTV